MAVIGFNIIDIKAKRNATKTVAQKGLEVNHAISITDVAKSPLNVAQNEGSEVLRVLYDFAVAYQDVGNVSIKGEIVFTDTKEIIEESAKSWKQDKKLPQMVDMEVRKFAYSKSLIQAMNLSDLLNLPAPIPLPKFELKK